MRKQTAPRIRKPCQASSTKQAGLIAQGNTAQQSATPSCALANHSHRTRIRQNCNNSFVHIPRCLIRESRAQAAD